MEKKLPEPKLQAFTFGAKEKVSKRDLLNKRKKQEDEEAAREFENFMATFQQPQTQLSKSWIKAGTYDAGARKEDTAEKGKLYKPKPRIGPSTSLGAKAEEIVKIMPVKKEKDIRKSNLELFKDELKQMQEERKERSKIKNYISDSVTPSDTKDFLAPDFISDVDPNTTNLFLPNINPQLTENQLMEMFGKYGPLASVKIMWPRTREEVARGKNCGFVAFMNRRDAERALKKISGREIMGFTMKMCWSKVVPIASQPIYVPPSLQKLLLPPPLSGLPFNAQADSRTLRHLDLHNKKEVERILPKTVVKVSAPTDRLKVCLIHRMVEFVVREGPMFEAIIMNKELNNPTFGFLFNNKCPLHVYYRWKLFSVLQGDSVKDWRMNEFRMFKGGSVWQPPPKNVYTNGMPECLFSDDDSDDDPMRELSITQRNRFEEILRNISVARNKIAEGLLFCIEHYQAVDEIVDCITQSLTNLSTASEKKTGRLYLVSDILYNVLDRDSPAKAYMNKLRSKMEEIFDHLHDYVDNLLEAEKLSFIYRGLRVLEAWETWQIFTPELISKLKKKIFVNQNESDDSGDNNSKDGSEGYDDTQALMKASPESPGVTTELKDDDVDGIPLSPAQDVDGAPLTPSPPRDNPAALKGLFVPSRWETVDPEEVEQQAMTTSKWEEFNYDNDEPMSKRSFDDSDSDEAKNTKKDDARKGSTSLSKVVDDEYRKQLREIEVKVMKYQDELESGEKKLKCGWNITQQIHHYRKSLMKKLNNTSTGSDLSRSERRSPSDDERPRRSKSRDRRDKGKVRDRSRDKSRDREKDRKRGHKRHTESVVSSSDDEGSQSSHHHRSTKKSRHDPSEQSSERSRHRDVSPPSPIGSHSSKRSRRSSRSHK